MNSELEAEQNEAMLAERLLHQDAPVQLNSSHDDEMVVEGACGLLMRQRTIKPLSKMTIRNDNVRRGARPDGRPAPVPYSVGFQIDIAVLIPILYLGEILGSFCSAVGLVLTMNSSLFIIGSSKEGECPEALAAITYALVSLVLIKTVLSCVASMILCNQASSDRNFVFTEHRVLLRRLTLQTRSTTQKRIYSCLILSDVLTFASLFICLPMRPESVSQCGGFYSILLLLLFVYQFVVAVRFPIMICCFMYRESFWRRVKRMCPCLGTVEYEKRVDFQIYDARDYVDKVNQEERQSVVEHTMIKLEELTCAICLDGFSERNECDPGKESNSQVVALLCNHRHTFHPPCLHEWLSRSPDCPLCKANVFTSEDEVVCAQTSLPESSVEEVDHLQEMEEEEKSSDLLT